MNQKNELTKESTIYIKGIAIILMFCNHLFPIIEWIYPENMYWSISIGEKTIASYIGGYGKICVAIFAFLTGIGFYHTLKKYKNNHWIIVYGNQIKKLFYFLIKYWIILYLFYLPIMIIFTTYKFTLLELLKNMFGISTTIIKVSWYVRFYIAVIITSPAIFFPLKKCKKKYSELFMLVFIFIIEGIILIRPQKYLAEYFNYLSIVLIGYICGKYKIIEKNSIFVSNNILCVVVIGGTVILRGFYKQFYFLNMDLLYVPILLTAILSFLNRNKVFWLKKIFSLLGKYSVELWFLHAIFFIGSVEVQRIGYWPKVDFLILLWSIILLFPIAVFYNKLSKLIFNFFEGN